MFEVEQKLREVNAGRRRNSRGYRLTGKSVSDIDLKAHPDWEVDYIAATPRMAYYIEHSTRIYKIYLNYIAPEDIHVYSIDEVFMDVTDYLSTYGVTAHELARRMIGDVLRQTGITATAGIGTNLYLCKVAMDIEAKHIPADKDGVRIAELDEMTYARKLWTHQTADGFLACGKRHSQQTGAIRHLHDGRHRKAVRQERGGAVSAVWRQCELLIDHAWGWEPCTMEFIKAYKPATNSFSSGQVLQEPYTVRKARVVVREMAESAALDLLDKRMVTDQLVLTIGYDTASLSNEDARTTYKGEVTTDYYGRKVPKHAHGTANLESPTSSARLISEAVMELFGRIVNPKLLVRRINLTTNHVVDEETAAKNPSPVQYDLFTDYEALERKQREEKERLAKERQIQTAILNIKKQFGKNAILKGLNYEEGATAKERNEQIGGHKA